MAHMCELVFMPCLFASLQKSSNVLYEGEEVRTGTGSVEDEDTGKLYMKDVSGMSYLTDLSGVQGIHRNLRSLQFPSEACAVNWEMRR